MTLTLHKVGHIGVDNLTLTGFPDLDIGNRCDLVVFDRSDGVWLPFTPEGV
jgi:hypothetical protein